MRLVSVNQGGVVSEEPGGAVIIGTDDNTGELIRFSASLRTADEVRHHTTCMIEVEDADILSITSNPVWDSPGTSPE